MGQTRQPLPREPSASKGWRPRERRMGLDSQTCLASALASLSWRLACSHCCVSGQHQRRRLRSTGWLCFGRMLWTPGPGASQD